MFVSAAECCSENEMMDADPFQKGEASPSVSDSSDTDDVELECLVCL